MGVGYSLRSYPDRGEERLASPEVPNAEDTLDAADCYMTTDVAGPETCSDA